MFLLVSAASLGLFGCKDKAQGPALPQAETAEAELRGPAIPFKVATLDGKEFSLEAKKGSLIVVNFWASWCGPCRAEAGELQKAYLESRGDGVEFIGVAVDDSKENAMAFVKKYGLTFPVGLDSTGEIMKAYNLYGIPKTYLIGRDGNVLYAHTGVITRDALYAAMKRTR